MRECAHCVHEGMGTSPDIAEQRAIQQLQRGLVLQHFDCALAGALAGRLWYARESRSLLGAAIKAARVNVLDTPSLWRSTYLDTPALSELVAQTTPARKHSISWLDTWQHSMCRLALSLRSGWGTKRARACLDVLTF